MEWFYKYSRKGRKRPLHSGKTKIHDPQGIDWKVLKSKIISFRLEYLELTFQNQYNFCKKYVYVIKAPKLVLTT